ncbi:MAG: hypothetical protein IPK57_17575 [Chitinophagaceae bacterium]|nr:hypothetical protein [Chitinophagaceae bacterium]
MRDRKHWNRWFWYMEGRLDVNDNIVNVAEKTNDAITLQRQNRANLTEAVSGDWIEVGPTAVNFGVANQRGIGRVDRIVFIQLTGIRFLPVPRQEEYGKPRMEYILVTGVCFSSVSRSFRFCYQLC